MANLIDYIRWRGDISFKTSKLNEVDKLIFMRISYLPFDEVYIKKDEKISLEELMYGLSNVGIDKFIWAEDKKLIDLLGSSERFKNLYISDYTGFIDKSIEKQFAAIVISSDDFEEYFVSFRGTDMTLVGWKEDFNMSFKYHLPSQIEGVNYLNRIGNKYSDKNLLIIGHSKGGNVAMYSSIFCLDYIKLKIKEIVIADAPGLTEEIINDIRYLDIKDKIVSFIPQTSIVGRLLETNNNYKVVESSGKMFMQHDIYTWNVGPTFLIKLKDASKESDFANNVIKDYLTKTSPEDRERFINIVYEVLESLEVDNVTDIPKALIINSKNVLKKYKNISIEDKAKIDNMLKQIKNVVGENIKLELASQNPFIDKDKEKNEIKNKEKSIKKEKKKKEKKINNEKQKKSLFNKNNE